MLEAPLKNKNQSIGFHDVMRDKCYHLKRCAFGPQDREAEMVDRLMKAALPKDCFNIIGCVDVLRLES